MERFDENIDQTGFKIPIKMKGSWGDWHETTEPVSPTGQGLNALPRYLPGASYASPNRGDSSQGASQNQAKNSQAIAMWNGKINVPMHGNALVHPPDGWYREVYVRPKHRNHEYYRKASNKNRAP